MSSTSGMMENLNKKSSNFRNALSCMREGPTLSSQEEQEYLKCLRAENFALTQQLMQTQLELEKAKKANVTLKSDHETKQALFEGDKRFLVEEIKSLRAKLNGTRVYVEKVTEEIWKLRRESETKDLLLKEERESKEALKKEIYELQQGIRTLQKYLEGGKQDTSRNQNILRNLLIREVDSLRGIQDMTLNEIKSIQTALSETKQNEISLELSMQKIHILIAGCEQIQNELNRTTESEQDLEVQIYKLRRSILEEDSQNEELNCKLEQRKNVESEANSSNIGLPITPKVRKVAKRRKLVSFVLDLEENCREGGEIEIISGDVGEQFF